MEPSVILPTGLTGDVTFEITKTTGNEAERHRLSCLKSLQPRSQGKRESPGNEDEVLLSLVPQRLPGPWRWICLVPRAFPLSLDIPMQIYIIKEEYARSGRLSLAPNSL